MITMKEIKPTSRNRWIVNLEGYNQDIKIYAETEEDVKTSFSTETILSILPCKDFEYIEYIKKLISHSQLLQIQSKIGYNRELYKLPFGKGYILFRLHTDEYGGYYDILDFQRHLNELLSPITFTMTDLTEFYKDYLQEEIASNHQKEQGWISTKELKKVKPKLFNNKGDYKFWVDSDGYFYVAEKMCYPNKRHRELFKKFGGEKEAIYVKTEYGRYYDDEFEWWHNRDEFLKHFRLKAKEVPAVFANPKYKIIHKGFTDVAPDDRKVILRLPYFNLNRELKETKNIRSIARTWLTLCNSKYIDPLYYELIEDLINKYVENIINKEVVI